MKAISIIILATWCAMFPVLSAGEVVGGTVTNGNGKLQQRVENEENLLRRGLWRSVGAAFIVVGGLILVNVFLKRRGTVRAADSGLIKVVERMPIDGRRQLMLVEVSGQRVLLACSPERIESLGVFSDTSVVGEGG